jgi:dipeptidyl aminopeptidase/acylaminoacyl peptidase
MKYFHLLLLLGLYSFSQAQVSNLLIEKSLITNWSEYPVYPYLTEEQNGEKVWKKEYQYLDSIDVYGITYLSDGLKVKGLMAKPKMEGNYPCIIYNRGGNRDFGSLKVATGATLMGMLAAEGYVVIASQYRGNAGGEGAEEFGGKDVNDVVNLVDVLGEVESADTSRIGMFGWSRGGMMTYIALTKTDKIKAAAVGGAVSDSFETIKDRPEMETGVMAEIIPDYEKNKEEELTKRSAVKWADRFPKDVPILLMHGTSDWRVKPEQSLNMAMEFEKYRVPYRLVMFEGGDHGISEHRAEVNEQVMNWFDRYLKKGEELPNMEYHGR